VTLDQSDIVLEYDFILRYLILANEQQPEGQEDRAPEGKRTKGRRREPILLLFCRRLKPNGNRNTKLALYKSCIGSDCEIGHVEHRARQEKEVEVVALFESVEKRNYPPKYIIL